MLGVVQIKRRLVTLDTITLSMTESGIMMNPSNLLGTDTAAAFGGMWQLSVRLLDFKLS